MRATGVTQLKIRSSFPSSVTWCSGLDNVAIMAWLVNMKGRQPRRDNLD